MHVRCDRPIHGDGESTVNMDNTSRNHFTASIRIASCRHRHYTAEHSDSITDGISLDRFTMATIRQLSDLLVNKIAAGEVIERPASVVKELLENALDAGATRISLTIEDGGRKLIRVSDNGSGIAPDELELAVRPHATSKIAVEQDLYRIDTMGFRGEALASMGAVAHLKVRTRPEHTIDGAEIYVAGEKIQSQSAAGCPSGTTVEVRDLFFNVPARRKFLRGANTEFGHVQEQLARVALPNPHVAFDFNSSTRTVKQLPGCGDMRDRIASFYGEELLDDLISIRREERGLSILGFAANPSQNRASGKWQYVFLNGRYIRDRYVQHAIKEAYRGLIEPHRFPVVFLALTIDPQRVDVNVHPTKIEVRWQDSNTVHSQVLSALRDTFLQRDLTPALSASRAASAVSPQDRFEERRRIAEFFKQSPPDQTAAGGSPGHPEPNKPLPSVSMSELALKFQADPQRALQRAVTSSGSEPISAPVIQLHRTYLVTEVEDGILIIDQHALHERILYEQLKQRIASGALESQRLLIAETIELTPDQVALLQSHENLLRQLGIDFTLYSETTVAIQSFPSILNTSAISEFTRDLIDHLGEKGNKPHTEVLIHDLLDMMACKAAVKAGDRLGVEEMQRLIERRHMVEKGSNCPHGRPTTLQFRLADLERQFKRT